MTSYLQRLFDRAAGLAARPATALTPSFASRSPIAEADQRLNLPDLAASLFALSPGFDVPSPGDDEALTGIEEPAARAMPRRAAPPIAASTEAPPLSPADQARWRPRLPVPPEQPLLTPAREARGARNIAPPHVAAPRERAVSQSAAEPASRPAALEPTPPAPRAIPQQPLEPGAAREPLQPREAETSATPLEPSPMPAAAKAEARVVRPLEPLPLPAPEPLPGPAPSPREVAERRQPPVTRREIVAAAAPEAAAQPPARMMPATAESVSRIGKLTPRRRAQLVFGLRRR